MTKDKIERYEGPIEEQGSAGEGAAHLKTLPRSPVQTASSLKPAASLKVGQEAAFYAEQASEVVRAPMAEIVELASRRGDDKKDILQKDSDARSRKAPALNAAPAEWLSKLLARLVMDESLPLYIALLDGSLVYVNDHYRVLDKSLGDIALAPGAAPYNIGRKVASLLPLIADVENSGATVRAEETVYVAGRERVFLGRHMAVRGDEGGLLAVAGTYEDVTSHVRGMEEISRTQARFQDFTRASADWFFETGPDLKLQALSERFTALVGQPGALFLGTVFEQFGCFEPNLDGRLDGLDAIKRRKPFRDLLFVLDNVQGRSLKFHLSGVPIFERRSGEFLGYRGVGMDVTTRYEQAEEAQKTRLNLERLLGELTRKNMALDIASEQASMSLRAKNEFLATMSHELRTPLNAIIGFADSFVKQAFGPLAERYVDFAGDISRSGRHLLGLINDILDVAVLDSGGLTLDVQGLCLEDVIDKAVHMNLEAAKKKELDTSGLAVSGKTMVKADERRLTQIFVNLLSNAIKFTPNGGRLWIDMAIDEDAHEIHIEVSDTGVGIPADKLDIIFEKFQQITGDVYSRSQEGTGLGLHISRELARRMSGDIKVISRGEGAGSSFIISLPLADGLLMENDDFI